MQWFECYCTRLHIKQSGFEPMVRVSALCSWAGHFTLILHPSTYDHGQMS